MSQVQRQDAGRTDRLLPDSSSQRGAASRGQNPPASPLTSNLIPRDFLGQRSEVQNQRHAAAAISRKLSPSPLQESHLPLTSPTTTSFDTMPSKTRPLTSTSVAEPLRSPTQASHIPDTPAESPESLKHTTSSIIDQNNTTLQEHKTTNGAMQPTADIRKMGDASRDLQHHVQMTTSPPESPTSTTSSVATDQLGHAIPRTSSIDSAVSSVSASPSQSHRPSTDTSPISPLEIASLTSSADSPETVIQQLLKEKQHAAAQNAQLWKLVDKQRTMLLGLNKDLERALKDKERYRKMVKEIQAQEPPMPQTAFRNGSEPPLGRVMQEEATRPDSQANIPKDAMTTPKKATEPSLASSPMDATLMPSPLHLQQTMQQSTVAAKDAQSEYLENHPPPSGPPPPPPTVDHRPESTFEPHHLTSKAKSETASSIPPMPVPGHSRAAPTRPPIQNLPAPPSVEVIEASTLVERAEKTVAPTKRPPPAPLNLNGAKVPSTHLLDPGSDSESDYGDILETDQIPNHDRGRRRTREADDRDREVVAKKAEEARSRSKKSSKADLKSEVTKSAHTSPSQDTVQRQIVPHSPPDGSAGGVNSLNALLVPGSLHQSVMEGGAAATPPMSPGLPMSPRPLNRPPGSPLPRMPREASGTVTSPPLSPRFGAMPSSVPLSPRAPKQPIPLPPNTPISLPSPPTGHAQPPLSPVPANESTSPRSDIPIIIGDLQADAHHSPTSSQGPQQSPRIFRGYVHEDYPDLLLPPNALPSIDVKVASSRLRPSRHSYMAPKTQDGILFAPKPQEEDPVFVLSVFARSNRSELWRVEKVILSLPQLDQQIKSLSSFSTKLPDRKLFGGHSPAVVDMRRNALNNYFEELLDTPMDEKAALVLCKFLSDDAIEPRDDETNLLAPSKRQQRQPVLVGPGGRQNKEGYLTKRGKNFGGWKARFFVLQGPELKYYESPGGAQISTIKLQNAQIGKQSQSGSPSRSEDDSENQYRHAFLILEPKRKDSASLVRHVLCAESDMERDAWVEALLQYVDYHSEEEDTRSSKRAESAKPYVTGLEAKIKQYSANAATADKETNNSGAENPDVLRGISYEATLIGQPPNRGETPVDRTTDETPSPTTTLNVFDQTSPSHEISASSSLASKSISGPVGGGVIQDVGIWGNKPIPQQATKEHKKRSIWGFRQRSSSDMLMQVSAHDDSDSSLPRSQERNHERSHPVRPVFGLPLAEAVEYCPPEGIDVKLPAVVYRCIEYLRAKDAASEEGIFRLSGSNMVVRNLKERFNTDGDVDFLADDTYYDVHAVASLFKSYLRELPTTILTRELHLDFLHVLELDNRGEKIVAFNGLVHRLPSVNLALLKVLSEYLLEIINNSDKNKMTVRNVGIVFSPTLNIPAPVFAMFLSDFESIFGTPPTTDIRKQTPARPQNRNHDKARTPSRESTTSGTGHHHAPPAVLNPMTSFPNPNATQKRPEHTARISRLEMNGLMGPPAYEQRASSSGSDRPQQQEQQLIPGPEYAPGYQHRAVAPGNAPNLKAKRRESSMFMMGMGNNRKSSMPQPRDPLYE